MAGILESIRVLDFGRYIAGPFCGALLGDLGAEVIRMEKVDGSEDRFTTPVNDEGIGAGFLQLNRNKRGMTLNPRKPEGQEVLARLVATADVVLANLPPDTLHAKPATMLSLLDRLRERYGSFRGYANDIGLSDALIHRLESGLLEPDSA